MKKLFAHRTLAALALAGITALTTACDSFLEVKNPNNLEADAIDEERDRTILSQSAFQTLVANYGDVAVYQAWFTNEARVGDTFPTRNDFGRRDIPLDGENGNQWGFLYNPITQAENTIRRISAAGNNLDLARAYFASGYGLLLVGETFCMGTVPLGEQEPGFPLSSAATIDSAIARLTKANDIAKALTGTDAANIANASMVAIARGHLQNGRRTQAATAAAAVPTGFTYSFLHLDDPANRGRLGNDLWSFSESRISLVVPPEYRAMADAGDTRIAYVDMGRPAQDGVLRFYRQNKITGWGSADRIASKLEAQYIEVEANQNAAAMFAFINTRRAAGNQTALAATTDMPTLMRELMEQKARDFWLENKRIGDFRRNPQFVPYIIAPGNNYYKPELGAVRDVNCYPVPGNEVRNNPNWQ